MENNFEYKKEEAIAKITAKAKNLICPICDNKNMILGDGFFTNDVQRDFSSRRMGGENIPTLPVICSECGFVREFSMGVLGLLPNENK
jgi:RNase P subunit RPR2